MKIALLYLRILKKFDPSFPEHKNYEESSRRFAATYHQFKPAIEHDLIVVNCGEDRRDDLFGSDVSRYEFYDGGGFDCGTYQAIGSKLKYDLILGLNTHTYFWRSGWLELFCEAAQRYGAGVYGATASFEHNPHLRTPSIAFSPDVIRKYPLKVRSRSQAEEFEAGKNNFSLWAFQKKIPAMLVTTSSGCWPIYGWRTPPNIFRRGDQSNCLIWDRHTDIYAQADESVRRQLENDANN